MLEIINNLTEVEEINDRKTDYKILQKLVDACTENPEQDQREKPEFQSNEILIRDINKKGSSRNSSQSLNKITKQ